jgi:hypothetical protein
MISRSRFVTANHCRIQNEPARLRFLHNVPSRESEVASRLRSLGFVDGALLSQATQLALDVWVCALSGQEGTRDLDYYFCDERIFEIRPGYFVRLHPGEIFGHVDITNQVPGNDASTNDLSTNRLLDDYLARPVRPEQVLLSPNGRRRTAPDQTCASDSPNAPPGGYSNCVVTQGDDVLGGSSGGIILAGANNRGWAVHNGSGWIDDNETDPYNARCWVGSPGFLGSHCNGNRNMHAPFTSNTAALQYSQRYSSLSIYTFYASNYSDLPLVGGGGGSLATHTCLHDEAVIGVITSTYRDIWAPDSPSPTVMGNFGVICAPMLDHPVLYSNGARYLQYDYATVRTSTSHDTGSITTVDSTPYPPRLNRYQSTILSTGHSWASPSIPFTRQESLVCPAGYAVAGINADTKYNMVRRIRSIVCRHAFESNRPDLTISVNNMGVAEWNSTAVSTTCPTGYLAVGARVRSGWFTDAIGLRCW